MHKPWPLCSCWQTSHEELIRSEISAAREVSARRHIQTVQGRLAWDLRGQNASRATTEYHLPIISHADSCFARRNIPIKNTASHEVTHVVLCAYALSPRTNHAPWQNYWSLLWTISMRFILHGCELEMTCRWYRVFGWLFCVRLCCGIISLSILIESIA